MSHTPRRASLLLLAAAAASLGTDCGQSPRGLEPSPIAAAAFRLVSRPAAAPPPGQTEQFATCLQRMGAVTNVVPSWRSFAVVSLAESAPNVFEARFLDVPVGVTNSITVHDPNQCRRDPEGNGRVTDGVSINGSTLERVNPSTGQFFFTIDIDGAISSPAFASATAG